MVWPLIGAIASGVISIAAANKARKQAIADQAEQRAYNAQSLTRLREEADKAGFNPLTALRAGALSAMQDGGRVLPSGGAVQAFQSFGNVLADVFEMKANEPIEKYNAEIRKLEIEQRKADLSIAKASLGQLSAPKETDFMDEYLKNPQGFTQMRSIAGAPIMVRNDILHRLRLAPGAVYGIAEDAEAIYGEIGGEVTGVGNIGDTFVNPIVKTPKLVKPQALRPTSKGRNKPRIQTKTLPPAWLQSTYDWLN